MSKESDAEPGQHHVARFLDENDRFCLKDLDEGREVRLVRERAVWTAGARLSPVTIACPRVALEPRQRVDECLVEFRLKASASARAAARDSTEPSGNHPGLACVATLLRHSFPDFKLLFTIKSLLTAIACCALHSATKPFGEFATTRVFVELRSTHPVEKLVQVDAL